MPRSNYLESGQGSLVLSYNTVIRQDVGGLSIGNITAYKGGKAMSGKAMRRHQREAGVYQCDVLLDDVPLDWGDLLGLAMARGLVRWEGNRLKMCIAVDVRTGEYTVKGVV